jgi:hypothetical protein
MSFIAAGLRLPRVFIVDENEIHLSQSFSCQASKNTTKVIIRMPPVPTEYFQVTSFSAWYEDRLCALKAYAAIQNLQHAKESIHFDVMVGSKHDVLRAFKAQRGNCSQSRMVGVC